MRYTPLRPLHPCTLLVGTKRLLGTFILVTLDHENHACFCHIQSSADPNVRQYLKFLFLLTQTRSPTVERCCLQIGQHTLVACACLTSHTPPYRYPRSALSLAVSILAAVVLSSATIHARQRRIHQDHSHAPCFIYTTSFWGFGSNLLGLLMTAAVHNSSEVYLDEAEWSYKCNNMPAWSHFFQGPLPRHGLPVDDLSCHRVDYTHGHEVMKVSAHLSPAMTA